NRFGPPMLRQLEKIIMLQTIDTLWKDHLLNMDHLKEGIGLRGYGQKNPLQEYQKEGFEMFEEMIHRVQEDVVQKLFTVEVASEHRPVNLIANLRWLSLRGCAQLVAKPAGGTLWVSS